MRRVLCVDKKCRLAVLVTAAWTCAAALFPAQPASAAAIRDSLAAASAAGQEGNIPIYPKEMVAGWLDDGTIDRLRQLPPAWSDTFHDTFDTGGTATGSGSAYVEAILLGAFAQAEANYAHPPNSSTTGEGWAYLKDTVSGSLLPSETVEDEFFSRFEVTFDVDGTAKLTGDSRVELGIAVRLTTALGEVYTQAEALTFDDGTEHGLHPEEIKIGGPTRITMLAGEVNPDFVTIEQLLYVRAQVGSHGAPGTATADFSQTMQIANIEFFDAEGQLVPGLQLVGAEGDIYPYNVPEPASVAGVPAAAGMLLRRRRRC